MASGIISTRKQLLHRLAFILEGTFADVEEGVDSDDNGIHETRPLYRRVYKRTAWRDHPDGDRRALILTPAAKLKLAALKAAIQKRRASGTASDEESDVDDLPAESELDSTWDGVSDPSLNGG